MKVYCPLDRQMDKLRKLHRPPTSFNPFNFSHLPSVNFLKANFIYSLFDRDYVTDQAMKILANPTARMALELCLISGAPYEMCVQVLERQHRVACSRSIVAKYAHFFMNQQVASREDIAQSIYVVDHTWATADDKDLTAVHIKAERMGYYADPRVIAARMPTDELSRQKVMLQNGISVGIEERLPEHINFLLHLAVIDMRAVMGMGGPEMARNTAMMATAIRTLYDLAKEMTTADQAAIQEFTQHIQVRNDRGKLPTAKQLTQGNRTMDVQPIQSAEDPVEMEEAEQEGENEEEPLSR